VEGSVATICIRFLLLQDVAGSKQSPNIEWGDRTLSRKCRPKGYVGTLIVYSAEHWPAHLRGARISTTDPLIDKLWQLCDIDRRSCQLWYEIAWEKANLPFSVTALLTITGLAAFGGHADAVRMLLQGGSTLCERENRKLLRSAVHWGYIKVVKLFLDLIKVNSTLEDAENFHNAPTASP
jgi:hypothetical protein